MAARRVLLVEDEGLIRLMIAETLRDEGFDVVQAENGDEDVSLLDQVDSSDVLFTDLQMPGKLDGIDVAVYARNRNPAMPVLVVSGVDAKRVMSRLDVLKPPAVFIHKPYSPRDRGNREALGPKALSSLLRDYGARRRAWSRHSRRQASLAHS